MQLFKSHSKVILISIFSGVALLACVAAKYQAKINTVIVNNYTYTDSGQDSLKIAGVCSADPQNFNCWSPTGIPDKNLSEQANAYFLAVPGALLKLKFKSPSLLLITMTNGQMSSSYVNDNSWKTATGRSITAASQLGYSNNGAFPQYNYYWMYPDPGQKSDDLYLTKNDQYSFPFNNLKVGTTFDNTSNSMTITGITEETVVLKSRNQQFYNGGPSNNKIPKTLNQKFWRVDYKRSNIPNFVENSLSSNLLGLDGQTIYRSDQNGKPLDSQNGQGYSNNLQMYDDVPVNQDDPSNDTGSVIIFVDPKYVRSITFNYQTQTQLEFPKIALQPNSDL